MGNFSCSHDFVKWFEVTSLWPLTVMMYREAITREVSEEFIVLFEDAVLTAGGKGMTDYNFGGSGEYHDTISEQVSK